MRRKIIIRIRRKNEFNGFWAFFITVAILLGALSLNARTAAELVMMIFVFSVIMVLATLYNGFEVIKE